MKNGKFVYLEKVESTNIMDGMLEEGYNLKGYLLQDINVGEKMKIARVERNGIEKPGIFTSSQIQEISENTIKTENSIWKIYYL